MIKRFAYLTLIVIALCGISQAAGDEITVHMMVHSHMDLGWIYTMQQYYDGTHSKEGGCVRCIFDNVLVSLEKNIKRKYMIAEVGFFEKWWAEQSNEKKDRFSKLVANDQVDFISGGWGSNDEACAYYEDIIDQFIIGHRWLKETFNKFPKSGWQIDPFGHSKTHAALMAQMGFSALYFGRIDNDDWENRRKNKNLEFNWKPENPRGESVFSRLLHVHYSDTKFMVSDNFNCRSIYCHGSLSDNDHEKVFNFFSNLATQVKTKNIFFLVGDDFHLWEEAEKDYVGVENSIEWFKNHKDGKMRLKFSYLDEYYNDFRDEWKMSHDSTEKLTEYKNDFFPYIENKFVSWAGYFTSKSLFKYKIREFSSYLIAAKLMLSQFVIKNNLKEGGKDRSWDDKISNSLFALEKIMAVVQHHDAVSGTNKEFVRKDWEKTMEEARSQTEKIINYFVNEEIFRKLGDVVTPHYLRYDWLFTNQNCLNMFGPERKSPLIVNVYNPGNALRKLIKIKIPSPYITVLNESNLVLPTDVICYSANADDICFAYFADDLPGYASKNYIIIPSTTSKRIVPKPFTGDSEHVIENQIAIKPHKDLKQFDISICEVMDAYDILNLVAEPKCIEDTITIDYEYYKGNTNRNGERMASGTYIFDPATSNRDAYEAPSPTGRIYEGRFITILQISRSEVRTDIRFVHDELFLGFEIESHYEPLKHWQASGEEAVILIKSAKAKNTDNEFYTDSNGYLMQKRKKDFREGYTMDNNIPVARNYFPITSAIYTEDPVSGLRLTVVTDRAQGATILNPGEIEIMVHRITKLDDFRGLGDALNERDDAGPIRVSTRHFVMYSIEKGEKIPSRQRDRQYRLDREVQMRFYKSDSSAFVDNLIAPSSSLQLPENIKIYVRTYKYDEYIVRFHNIDDYATRKIDIFDLMTNKCTLLNQLAGVNDLVIDTVTELSLLTTKDKADIKPNELDKDIVIIPPKDSDKLSAIELLPQEIRTFKILVKPSK